MKKKFMVIRLQEPTLKIDPFIRKDPDSANFIVGQSIGVYDSEPEAEAAIRDIIQGENTFEIAQMMSCDHGLTIIPFYEFKTHDLCEKY